MDASNGGSAARAMEIDNTISATLSNLKLLASTFARDHTGSLATGRHGRYECLHGAEQLISWRRPQHTASDWRLGTANSAFQIIGGTARTNNTTDGTGVLLEYASNMDFLGFDVESALVGYSFGSGAMQNILTEARTEGNTTDFSFISGAAYNRDPERDVADSDRQRRTKLDTVDPGMDVQAQREHERL